MSAALVFVCQVALQVTSNDPRLEADLDAAASSALAASGLEAAAGAATQVNVAAEVCKGEHEKAALGKTFKYAIVAGVAVGSAPHLHCSADATSSRDTSIGEAWSAAHDRWTATGLPALRNELAGELGKYTATHSAVVDVDSAPTGALVTLSDPADPQAPRLTGKTPFHAECLTPGRRFVGSAVANGFITTEFTVEAAAVASPQVVTLRKENPMQVMIIQSWVLGPQLDRYLAWGLGGVFVLLLIAIALFVPKPTEFQEFVFRATLALSLAGLAGLVPGFLSIDVEKYGMALRGGGALAVFIVVYLINPARFVTRSGAKGQEKKKKAKKAA